MCFWKYQYTCTHSGKNICIIYSREKHRFAEQSLDSINHRWTTLQCDNACYHDEINEMFQHAMIPSENHLSAVFNIHRKQFICFIFPPRSVLAWQQTILFFYLFLFNYFFRCDCLYTWNKWRERIPQSVSCNVSKSHECCKFLIFVHKT